MRTTLSFRSSMRRNQRGASMVEFALGFIVFLVVVVGLVDLGRGVWAYSTVAHAARQGVRYAAIHGSENPATADQIRDVVRAQAVGLNRDDVEVTTTWESGVERGGVVRVQVRYMLRLVTAPLVTSSSTIRLGSNARAILAN